jgi:DNA-binding response OmpR family regulator
MYTNVDRPTPRLLLADDDVELCLMLKDYLLREALEVEITHDGQSALNKALNEDFDIILMDVMMPRMSGLDALRALRAQKQTPVLMLTARGEDMDTVLGLELGADDYLPKPCNPKVLLARIRAVLRRSEPHLTESGTPATILQIGDLTLNSGARSVKLKGNEVPMTSTEFSILEILLREAGHLVTKGQLSEQVLGRPLGRFDRSLDMHVSNLRQKLGPSQDGGSRIKTIRGSGFQYVLA